jgi:hypothetical protein
MTNRIVQDPRFDPRIKAVFAQRVHASELLVCCPDIRDAAARDIAATCGNSAGSQA